LVLRVFRAFKVTWGLRDIKVQQVRKVLLVSRETKASRETWVFRDIRAIRVRLVLKVIWDLRVFWVSKAIKVFKET